MNITALTKAAMALTIIWRRKERDYRNKREIVYYDSLFFLLVIVW